jgi:anti-sigma-K factor RskA
MTDGDDLRRVDPGAHDLDGLLGAYVLDALDDERARVEAHLATNPAARAEVDRLIASFDAVVSEDVPELAPPAALWGRIAQSLPPRLDRVADSSARQTSEPSDPGPPDPDAGGSATSPPIDELAARREAKRSRGGSSTTRIILSVAAAVVVVLVGIAVVRQSSTTTRSVAQQLQEDADAAAEAPGSKTATLANESGTTVRVVVDESGRGFVMPENLPPLDEGSTYQLWSVDQGTPVSLGLLGSDPGITVVAAGADPTTMAITAEPAGGSPAPTSDIVVSGSFA